jgi:hypothetical protein
VWGLLVGIVILRGNGYENNVAQLTGNVLRWFVESTAKIDGR